MVKHNCEFCVHFRHEEIGDNDFGGVYADEPTCGLVHDMDANGDTIVDFDREVERDCCNLDYWRVLEVDQELYSIFRKEDDFKVVYDAFTKKYLNQ